MNIRPYEDRDEADVVRLWTAVFGYASNHNEPIGSLRRKVERDRELLRVADDGAAGVIGTIMGGYDGHRGWIYSLAVDPAHRGRGVATALVRQMERLLAERGCPKINLQVLGSNEAVVDFYRKLGYAVEPRISMGKILPQPPK